MDLRLATIGRVAQRQWGLMTTDSPEPRYRPVSFWGLCAASYQACSRWGGRMPLYERSRSAGCIRRLGHVRGAGLQRLLRDDSSALDEDLLVIAEEWADEQFRGVGGPG